MRRCEDEQMWRWEDVKMRRCEDEKMWRCEDDKMWRWEDVKMRRCKDEQMRRWEDVKMRKCEDEKMWRWADVKMRRCEVKMWRCENVRQTPTIRRPLSGKNCANLQNNHKKRTLLVPLWIILLVVLQRQASCALRCLTQRTDGDRLAHPMDPSVILQYVYVHII